MKEELQAYCHLYNRLNQSEEKEQQKELLKEIARIEQTFFSSLSPFQRVELARHPMRPQAMDYIEYMMPDFIELHGDRYFGDDPAVVAGIGTLENTRWAVVGQRKGKTTEERILFRFGMPNPEGYRKSLRVMKLAEQHKIPVIALVDTPGAYAGLEAEERGQGRAIADSLYQMSLLTVPVIVVLIGEACSGGALAMGVGDHIAMLKQSYYTVISPEACASILWKDPKKKEEAARQLHLHSEFLLANHLIDEIIEEPDLGAHSDPTVVMESTKQSIMRAYHKLSLISAEELSLRRHQKFRSMGRFLEP